MKALPRYDEDDAATLVVVARNVTSAVVYVLADENHALVLQLLRLVGLNYRSKYGRGALPSTHGVPHDSAAKKAKLHTGLISKSLSLLIRAMKIMIPARVRPRSYWAPFGLGSSSTRVELRVGLRSGCVQRNERRLARISL